MKAPTAVKIPWAAACLIALVVSSIAIAASGERSPLDRFTSVGGNASARFSSTASVRHQAIVLKSGAASMWTVEDRGTIERIVYLPRISSGNNGLLEMATVASELFGSNIRFMQDGTQLRGTGVLTFDRMWPRSGRVHAYTSGHEGWLMVAASSDDTFVTSSVADAFLASLRN